MTENAVLQLRQYRLAQSTRPFRARGCRVIRCQRCLLPQVQCLCSTIQPQSANSQFGLVMFDSEPLKPSNTGRLIADILPDTQAFLWSRTDVDPALLATINDPSRQPYVIFPEQYADPNRKIYRQLPDDGKPPLFILLDGTWSEARKMFRKSPYLDSLPLFCPDITHSPGYLLREAHRADQFCTAEVGIALLEKAGDIAAAQGLFDHFTRFKHRYMLGKPHHPVSCVTTTDEKNI